MLALSRALAILAAVGLAQAHTVITYPGWRGDNLHTNGTPPEFNPNSIGIDYYSNGTTGFPYGMQWMYPCAGGGMPQAQNRTKWPFKGGAVSVQPGWFPGHSKALFYMNIGIIEPGQLAPPNYSHPVVPPFQIVGPDNLQYDAQFCLPQVPMPANLSLQIGDNITLQVIETAQHGASLYSVSNTQRMRAALFRLRLTKGNPFSASISRWQIPQRLSKSLPLIATILRTLGSTLCSRPQI
nr:hypothetical protein CFP56_31626 [Quercus suber]